MRRAINSAITLFMGVIIIAGTYGYIPEELRGELIAAVCIVTTIICWKNFDRSQPPTAVIRLIGALGFLVLFAVGWAVISNMHTHCKPPVRTNGIDWGAGPCFEAPTSLVRLMDHPLPLLGAVMVLGVGGALVALRKSPN